MSEEVVATSEEVGVSVKVLNGTKVLEREKKKDADLDDLERLFDDEDMYADDEEDEHTKMLINQRAARERQKLEEVALDGF